MSQKFLLENGNTLEIIQDENLDNPREQWESLGTMVCFHKRYLLGDKHTFKSEQFGGWGDMKQTLTRTLDVAVILPIYMYDHSGLTIKTTPFSCPWDSGQIGYIFVSKEKARKEYKVKRLSKKKLALIENVLLAEIETYDQYLTGDVYGYKLLDSEGNEIESVWGFYGSDPHKNGMMENINSPIVKEINNLS